MWGVALSEWCKKARVEIGKQVMRLEGSPAGKRWWPD